MRAVWLEAMRQSANAQPETIPPLHRDSHSGAVKATTGLGLPLCRGFAQRSGGWLALDQSQGDGMTHLWCVIDASVLTLSKSRRLSMKLSAHTLEQASAKVIPPEPLQASDAVQPLNRAFGSNNSVRELMEKGKGGGSNGGYEAVRRLSFGFGDGIVTASNGFAVQSQQQQPSAAAFGVSTATGVSCPAATARPTVTGERVAIVHIGDIQSKRRLSMGCATMSSHAQAAQQPQLSSSCTAHGDTHSVTDASIGNCAENIQLVGEAFAGMVTAAHPLARTGKSFRSSKYMAGVTRKQIDYKDMRVAIVDDEAANQRVGIRFLKMLGVKAEHISVFSDGKQQATDIPIHV